MAYTIARHAVHKKGNNMDLFSYWIHNISFPTEIQPLYPTITEQEFYAIVYDYSSFVAPLREWEKLFTGAPGFISYSYTFAGYPENPTVTSFSQEFVFSDIASYTQWQANENELSNTRLSGWCARLEENTIDYSNIIIEGTQMINTITGATTDLSVIQYLSSKYCMLRQTQLSIVHSIT